LWWACVPGFSTCAEPSQLRLYLNAARTCVPISVSHSSFYDSSLWAVGQNVRGLTRWTCVEGKLI
ncbi:hypothetical protein N9Z64_02195, partial [bacterium]|nr:hypothetical protein [bacterium]